MAELATVARPYAEALFRIAPANQLGAWSALLTELAAVAGYPEVHSLASNPKVAPDQVVSLLLAALKGDYPETLREPVSNFIAMLVANHRLTLLPQIAEQFDALKNASEGAADAEIVSAFPLEGAPLEQLVAGLERRFKCKLKPIVSVDRELIGGVRVTVGDEVLDTSVRARLNQMQTALTA
jgi:F-type H+-transporting ATPase subunit delta